MADSEFAQTLIRDTALRFGLAWNITFSIPVAARTAAGIRIGAVLDQLRHPANRLLKAGTMVPLGPNQFFPAESHLKRDGEIIRLTEKERDILLILLEAEGRVIARENLLHTVWGYASDVETHTLETHIYRLRHKIEPQPGKPVLLLTAGEGYRLNLPD